MAPDSVFKPNDLLLRVNNGKRAVIRRVSAPEVVRIREKKIDDRPCGAAVSAQKIRFSVVLIDQLPQAAKDYVIYIEKLIDCPITMISTGPDRKHMIYRK